MSVHIMQVNCNGKKDGRPAFSTSIDDPRRQLLRVELTTVGSNQLK